MPYTLNGIGTTYYGKKNLTQKEAFCQHCNRDSVLMSYDTRLWFVIFFIPIIPLGKKKILDQCKKCSRHYEISLEDYNREKEEAIQAAREDLKANPNNPEVAFDVYRTLKAYADPGDVNSYVEMLEKKFPDNSLILYVVGCHHEDNGDEERACDFFHKALKADPENPNAKIAVAIIHMEEGNPAKARDLLSFMMQPGDLQDPSILFVLAESFGKRGEYHEALSVCKVIARDFPLIPKKDKTFRKAVKKFESKTGGGATMLPPPDFHMKTILAVLSVLAVISIGLFFLNGYLRDNNELVIVNETAVKAWVEVPGRPSIAVVTPKRKVHTKISEGRHNIWVEMEGGKNKSIPVNIACDVFDRFFSDRLYVLNVGGGAVLVKEEIAYSEKPNNEKDRIKFYVGDEFMTFWGIDFPFQAFPDTISVSDNNIHWRSKLHVLKYTPDQLVNLLYSRKVATNKILAYAETHLLTGPENNALIDNWFNLSLMNGKLEECHDFLLKGIGNRPVNTEWHRLYQTASMYMGLEEKLPGEYDSMLAKEPDNSALLYLRSRIETSGKKALGYLDRSIECDKKNPYPVYSKAYYLSGCGDFARANELGELSYKLGKKDEGTVHLLYNNRFALKEFDLIQKEAEETLSIDPLDIDAFQRLVMARAAKGDKEGVRETFKINEKRIKELKISRESRDMYIASNRLLTYAALNEIEEYLKTGEKMKDSFKKMSYLFHGNLILGNLDEAEKLIMGDDGKLNGYDALLLYIGWMNKGDQKRAEAMFKKTIEMFNQGDMESRIMTDLIARGDENLAARVEDMTISISNKRIIYTALARKFPDQKIPLAKMAKKLNEAPSVIHGFFERSIDMILSEG